MALVVAANRFIYLFSGAGEGNRTLATSLEGWGSTTELHPQYADNNGKTNFINH